MLGKIKAWFTRLFDNPSKAQIGIFIALSLLILAFATQCRSADLSFELGSTVVRGPAPVIGFALTFPGAGPKDADYLCTVHLIGSAGANSNQAAYQCMLVDGFKKFDVGFGLAYLHHTDEYNGSCLNFGLMLGLRMTDHLVARYRHISNAGMQAPNLGRDYVLVSYRF